MFKRKSKPVDATAEVERIEGERGASTIGRQTRRRTPGARMFMWTAVAILLIAGGLMLWWVSSSPRMTDAQRAAQQAEARKALPKLRFGEAPPKEEPVALPVEAPAQDRAAQPSYYIPPDESAAAPEKKPETLRDRLLKGQAGSAASSGAPKVPVVGVDEPQEVKMVKASILKNRQFLMTAGANIECQLHTRYVSTVPGMVVCFTTQDAWSDTGDVNLLERGTKITAWNKGTVLKQGEDRVPIEKATATTPKGVRIFLDSPFSGPLGEGGIDGHVNTHLPQRFGGTIALGIIGDFGKGLSSLSNKSDATVQFSGGSQGMSEASAEALRNSINIPNTITKNQGERVSILIVRDLDFSSVYSLRSK